MSDKKFYLNSSFDITNKDATSDDSVLRIAGYANTVDRDRTGDIIEASAWVKGVENFRRNPVLLFQHKHDTPIGSVEHIKVDSKGLYIEAAVSSVAERIHGVHTLIKDKALKSFSVGFIPKKGKYIEKTDTYVITELELLEISVVSVPANQNSLFSLKKGFGGNDEEWQAWRKSVQLEIEPEIKEATVTDDTSKIAVIEMAAADVAVVEKAAVVEEVKVAPVVEEKAPKTEEEKEEDDPMAQIPFVNLLSLETSKVKNGTFVRIDGKRWKTSKIATQKSPSFQFKEVDLEGHPLSKILNIDAKDISVVNIWDIDSNFDLRLINHALVELTDGNRANIKTQFKELVTASEQDLFKLKNEEFVRSNLELQERLNKTINLVSTKSDDWTDTNYSLAQRMNNLITELKEFENLENVEQKNLLTVLGYKPQNKENKDMAIQAVDEPVTISSGAKTEESAATAAGSVVVSEPRVADLIKETGKAIEKQTDAQIAADGAGRTAPNQTEEVAELKAQLTKYRDQITAFQNSKMAYVEGSRAEQFSQKDIANAWLLSMALRKDVKDTKFGARVAKAVTSVDAFLSTFSTEVYGELQQELVIAPMLNRMSVDAKTFRVPVADEDTDGDVAQFASGTYVTGIADNTNVPTTNQHAISSVSFTPHKWMATTHIAKDEEEDTILPLLDFLRKASLRRMGRAIDKSLLRGDGSLSGFTASPTNAITAGTGYASVIKGVATLANDISGLRIQTGGNSTKATPANIASARAAMGKYALTLGAQLVYLTTIEGYNELVQTSDFRTVDKFGPNATYLTGSIGAVYGIPVVITEFLDVVGGADRHVGLLVYKPGFLIAERRAMDIESEYDPRRQVTAVYMSTRFDMKALTTNASAALDATKYAFASVVRSGA